MLIPRRLRDRHRARDHHSVKLQGFGLHVRRRAVCRRQHPFRVRSFTFLLMANFRHRILVHRSSRLCINTPRPASSWASKQASAVPLFSPLSSCDSTSRRAIRRLLEPTRRISSSRSRNLYVSDLLIARSPFRSRRTSLSTQRPRATRFHLRQIVP